MRLPIQQLTKLATSPKGRKMIEDARTKLDTPANRKKVADAVEKVRSRQGGNPPGSGGTSR